MKTKLYKDKTPRMQYLDTLAIKKGFESHLDYLNAKAIEKGFKSYSDEHKQWLAKKGKTFSQYQKELIEKRGFKPLTYQEEISTFLKEINDTAVACEALRNLIIKHPKMIEDIFETDIKEIKEKTRNVCKRRLLSEII